MNLNPCEKIFSLGHYFYNGGNDLDIYIYDSSLHVYIKGETMTEGKEGLLCPSLKIENMG